MKMKGGKGGGGGGDQGDGMDAYERISKLYGSPKGAPHVRPVSPDSIYVEFNHSASGGPRRAPARATARSRVAGGGPGSRGRH